MDSEEEKLGMVAAEKTEKKKKKKELHFSMFSNTREVFDLIEQLVKTAVTEYDAIELYMYMYNCETTKQSNTTQHNNNSKKNELPQVGLD